MERQGAQPLRSLTSAPPLSLSSLPVTDLLLVLLPALLLALLLPTRAMQVPTPWPRAARPSHHPTLLMPVPCYP